MLNELWSAYLDLNPVHEIQSVMSANGNDLLLSTELALTLATLPNTRRPRKMGGTLGLYLHFGFSIKNGDIPFGGIHSVQLTSTNVWISRSLAVVVLIVCSSMQANPKPHRTVPPDLHVNSPHTAYFLSITGSVYINRSSTCIQYLGERGRVKHLNHWDIPLERG